MKGNEWCSQQLDYVGWSIPAQAPLPSLGPGCLEGCVRALGGLPLALCAFCFLPLTENSVSGSCKSSRMASVAESWGSTELPGQTPMLACQETLMCVAELCLKLVFMVPCHLVGAGPCGRSLCSFSSPGATDL